MSETEKQNCLQISLLLWPFQYELVRSESTESEKLRLLRARSVSAQQGRNAGPPVTAPTQKASVSPNPAFTNRPQPQSATYPRSASPSVEAYRPPSNARISGYGDSSNTNNYSPPQPTSQPRTAASATYSFQGPSKASNDRTRSEAGNHERTQSMVSYDDMPAQSKSQMMVESGQTVPSSFRSSSSPDPAGTSSVRSNPAAWNRQDRSNSVDIYNSNASTPSDANSGVNNPRRVRKDQPNKMEKVFASTSPSMSPHDSSSGVNPLGATSLSDGVLTRKNEEKSFEPARSKVGTAKSPAGRHNRVQSDVDSEFKSEKPNTTLTDGVDTTYTATADLRPFGDAEKEVKVGYPLFSPFIHAFVCLLTPQFCAERAVRADFVKLGQEVYGH